MSKTLSFGGSTTPKTKTLSHTQKKAFISRLQPVTSRAPAIPPVNYEKGGSDFRCPENISSLGKQTLMSGSHRSTEPRVRFASSDRFHSNESVGVGPMGLGPLSSIRKQSLSHRRSAESTSFGTSSRDGALKLYAIYTCKKN
jgi:hypothetical protein